MPTARSVHPKRQRFRERRTHPSTHSLSQKKVLQRNQPKVLKPDSPMLKFLSMKSTLATEIATQKLRTISACALTARLSLNLLENFQSPLTELT